MWRVGHGEANHLPKITLNSPPLIMRLNLTPKRQLGGFNPTIRH